MTRTVIVIGGPTGGGKSALALALAERLSGVVINADSLQVYDGLPLLTAQPSMEEKARAPHALYGALAPDDACSAARWRDMALAEIERTEAPAIVAGGTGFYIRTLMEGISPMPDVPPEFRERAIALQKEVGNPAFHEMLKRRDPETAARLDPFNTQRNVRAWEVLEATGKGLAHWQAAPPVPPPGHLRFFSVALIPERGELYRRCDARFDAMMAAGALEEARAFSHPSSPLNKALGYAELRAHLAGGMTRDEAVAAAKQATRNYAKRQVTWFRNQLEADLWLEEVNAEKVLSRMGI